MYSQVNIEALSEILDVGIDIPPDKFNMIQILVDECGCLVGHWNKKKKTNFHVLPMDLPSFLGLSQYEAAWLFLWTSWPSAAMVPQWDYLQCIGHEGKDCWLPKLAKFIAYKRRKKKVFEDYDAARKIEGDQMYTDVKEILNEKTQGRAVVGVA